jgi:hypothetical protein
VVFTGHRGENEKKTAPGRGSGPVFLPQDSEGYLPYATASQGARQDVCLRVPITREHVCNKNKTKHLKVLVFTAKLEDDGATAKQAGLKVSDKQHSSAHCTRRITSGK